MFLGILSLKFISNVIVTLIYSFKNVKEEVGLCLSIIKLLKKTIILCKDVKRVRKLNTHLLDTKVR